MAVANIKVKVQSRSMKLAILGILMCACQAPQGTAGFIDPVFAYAVPSTGRLFSSVVRSVIVLPETGTSAALYAGLEELAPRVVLLSPLLASEIDSILSMDDSRIVAIFGEGSRSASPRLHSAEFSPTEAARLAGSAAATENSGFRPGSRVAGVFAGAPIENLRKASAAFAAAYAEAGGSGTPILETTEEDFSQALAQNLVSLDIGIAYVSAPPDTTERWLREAFDPFAYLMVEMPLPSSRHQTLADAMVVWDIGATLRTLFAGIENGSHGQLAGIWGIKLNDTRQSTARR
jgi:hypothetical protein